MLINHLTDSQICSIASLVKPTIFYHCKKKKIFLEPYEVDIIISDIQYKAILSSRNYDPSKQFAPWVRSIAKTCLLDYLISNQEHQKKFRPLITVNTKGDLYETICPNDDWNRGEPADKNADTQKSLQVISDALDSLGYVGQAFWLQHMGYSDKEIAQQLGKSSSAIRTRKTCARKALARNQQIISLCKEYGVKISA